MARYFIIGAGAVGGLIGARLHMAGHDVTLTARGAHLAAMRSNGLTIRTPKGSEVVRMAVAEHLSELSIGADDVVILGLKTQDAALILDDLAAVAHPRAAIVCAQNGVEGERLALRRFANVYGIYVYCNAVMVDPGVALSYTGDCWAILDIGRYPIGNDAKGRAIAADLAAAGFSAQASEDIMYWKRAKLVLNTMNASQASCESREAAQEFMAMTVDEARRAMAAAGLAFASIEEVRERAVDLVMTPIDGEISPGGSTFQSLARGNATTEADYLNGEIAMLGRLHGVPTPANTALQALMRRMSSEGLAPCSIPADEIRRLIAAAG
jgi:2-dehydropantoate 2-reductase